MEIYAMKTILRRARNAEKKLNRLLEDKDSREADIQEARGIWNEYRVLIEALDCEEEYDILYGEEGRNE